MDCGARQRVPAPRGAERGRVREPVADIRRTAEVVQRALARLIEPFGVTDQQYNVLRILRGAHPAALNTLEIGERMIERMPNVTRLLDRLELKGLVVRQRCRDDRRVVHCWISAAGLELLAEMDEPFTRTIQALVRNLGEEEQRQLVTLLEQVRRGGPEG